MEAMRDAAQHNPAIQAEIARNAEREPVCPSGHSNDPEPVIPPAKKTAKDWRRVGRCALRDAQPQAAVEAFQHATAIEPSAEAYSLLGLALVRAGCLSEVTPVLRKAAHADPQEDQLYRAWGAYYLAQGELDRAASYYEKAIDMLHPEGLGFGQVDHDYSTLAAIYAKQGNHRAAAKAYEEDCFAMVCSADTSYRFGVELTAIGDHEKLNMLIESATDKDEADRLRALAKQ
jgi:tetratricopeptide (TPR) repeat protein